jgi:hypothetical protein
LKKAEKLQPQGEATRWLNLVNSFLSSHFFISTLVTDLNEQRTTNNEQQTMYNRLNKRRNQKKGRRKKPIKGQQNIHIHRATTMTMTTMTTTTTTTAATATRSIYFSWLQAQNNKNKI